MRREYPATSAARMAASLRSTRPVAKAVLLNRVGRIGHRLSSTILMDPLHSENLFCRFGSLCQQPQIHNLVRDLLLDDQLVLGIDGDLHVVAHRNMCMRRHPLGCRGW